MGEEGAEAWDFKDDEGEGGESEEDAAQVKRHLSAKERKGRGRRRGGDAAGSLGYVVGVRWRIEVHMGVSTGWWYGEGKVGWRYAEDTSR